MEFMSWDAEIKICKLLFISIRIIIYSWPTKSKWDVCLYRPEDSSSKYSLFRKLVNSPISEQNALMKSFAAKNIACWLAEWEKHLVYSWIGLTIQYVQYFYLLTDRINRAVVSFWQFIHLWERISFSLLKHLLYQTHYAGLHSKDNTFFITAYES